MKESFNTISKTTHDNELARVSENIEWYTVPVAYKQWFGLTTKGNYYLLRGDCFAGQQLLGIIIFLIILSRTPQLRKTKIEIVWVKWIWTTRAIIRFNSSILIGNSTELLSKDCGLKPRKERTGMHFLKPPKLFGPISGAITSHVSLKSCFQAWNLTSNMEALSYLKIIVKHQLLE